MWEINWTKQKSEFLIQQFSFTAPWFRVYNHSKQTSMLNFNMWFSSPLWLIQEINCSITWYTYLKCQVLTSPNPNTRYWTVIIYPKHTHRCKCILPHLIQPLVHAWNTKAQHLVSLLMLHTPHYSRQLQERKNLIQDHKFKNKQRTETITYNT